MAVKFDNVNWSNKVFQVSEEAFLNHMKKCKVQEKPAELKKKRTAKRKELGISDPEPKKQSNNPKKSEK